MKKIMRAALGLALTMMAVPGAYASKAEAIAMGRQVISSVEQRLGFCSRDSFHTDHIELGQTISYSTFLYRGGHYILATGGDNNAVDLDVALYDENGNLIDNDLRYEQGGMVNVVAYRSGTFYFKVRLTSGSRKGAWIYIIHFYQC